MLAQTRPLALASLLACLAPALLLGGCKDEAPRGQAKPNGPGPAAEPEASAEPAPASDGPRARPPARLPEGGEPGPPAEPESDAKPAIAKAGFSVGPMPSDGSAGPGEVEVEVTEPVREGAMTLRVGYAVEAASEADDEADPIWNLKVEVEFAGADAAAKLHHERATALGYVERVLVSSKPIATLPDGRWLVDTWLSGGAGEDSYATITEHSVVLVDPRARSAAVVWTGSERSLSDGGGACVSDSHHDFAVDGDALVVRRTERTIADPELIESLGWGPEDCQAKPKARAEVARIPLTGA